MSELATTDIVAQFKALDPTGAFFLGIKPGRGTTKTTVNPIGWSSVFTQPVRNLVVKGLTFDRLLGHRDNVPPVDMNFIPLGSDVASFRAGLHMKTNIALSGPAGTGKSSFVEYMAAILNRPFFVYDVNEDTRPEIMLGQYLPVDGNKLEWKDGPVTKALRNEGSFFLLDEANMASGSILASMHRVLASRETTLHEKDGEVIKASPGVVFSMACNALNDSNSASIYHDIKPMNRAFLDRFGIVIRTGYPKARQEQTIILKIVKETFPDKYQHLISTGFKNMIPKLVQVASDIRNSIDEGDMAISFSLRRTLEWSKALAYYEDLTIATKQAILNLEESEDAKTIDVMVHTAFGTDYKRHFKDD